MCRVWKITPILNLYGGVDHLKKMMGGNIMKDFLKDLELGEDKIKLSNEDIKNILKKHFIKLIFILFI